MKPSSKSRTQPPANRARNPPRRNVSAASSANMRFISTDFMKPIYLIIMNCVDIAIDSTEYRMIILLDTDSVRRGRRFGLVAVFIFVLVLDEFGFVRGVDRVVD